MTSIISVMCLGAALVGARLDVKLDGEAQVFGGYSHSPFTVGPDATPLPNAPVTPGRTTYNLILSPGADLTLKMRDVSLNFGYTPRVFIDLQSPFGSRPQVFHRLKLGATIGRPQDWLVTLGGSLTLGGLDFGGAGQPSGIGTGTVQSAAQNGQSALSSYVNMSALARAEHPIDRSFTFSTTATASKLITPSQGPVASPGVTTSGVALDPNAPAMGQLQLHGIERLESKNELLYKIDEQNALAFDLAGSVVRFPQEATYWGVTPELAYQITFNRLTKFDIKAGFLHYWTSPFAGRTDPAQNLWVGEVGAEHTFAEMGLPRLKGRLSLSEAPWYDLIYGTLEPRAMLTANLMYQFTHALEAQVQLRDFTEAYFDDRGWRPIPVNHDKNVAILSSQLKYTYAPWLSYTAGVFYLDRQIVPSGTSTNTQIKEVFFYLGLSGTYDLE